MKKFPNRYVLKISGESLGNKDGLYNYEQIANLTNQIKELHENDKDLIIIIGGGNIWRGKLSEEIKISQDKGDYMGMLATIMNSVVFAESLKNIGVPVELFSSFTVEHVAVKYSKDAAMDALKNKKVVIISGGTGLPFFTTDTTAVLRASELFANTILMGKNGVDGVYEADPKTHPGVKRFDFLSYDEAINKKIKIMDETAFTMCKNQKIKILVFNASEENAFIKCLNNKIKYTTIN
ncbi:hypothetical protein ASO20_02680 [Mycoplasma sp. (ex Biomphalaria glabrata)]|uniref:UMP kinase n=1 Tax=Mycoplasma sp. (ex Biomphalaria glabrata) TaxID=1749074 RepID=UPI00073AE2AA|nr:UMP kinase [Mycoplasma sp. (ex Biomphalaria glabrata)]ALV23540.1 hypothetical protein ASO20_02680 [Mycoplasma sp. (ex Biomphalaria glabrata)]